MLFKNNDAGLSVSSSSVFIGTEATLTVQENKQNSINVGGNTHAEARNVTMQNNSGMGIFVFDNSSVTLTTGNAVISGNGNTGVLLARSSTGFFFPAVRIVDHSSAAGVRLTENSNLPVQSPVVRNNQTGISVTQRPHHL